jgi:geranylgeranyl diphosphate synthase type II
MVPASFSPASVNLVERVLARDRQSTIDQLLKGLPTGTPQYLYDLVPDYPCRLSKGLRASLCLTVCRMFGGELAQSLPLAVAIELFHNAFLIHDDAQDGSERRRGMPTLQAQHGLGIAINVGNAMNLLALGQLRGCSHFLGPARSRSLFAMTYEMLRQALEGQAMELEWIRDNRCDLGDEDYYRMCLKKTAWYSCIYPCRVGMLAAGVGRLQRLDRFGWYLGAAFQVQDDLLNLIGDEAKYGKEIGGDLWEGKRTLMIIHLLRHADARVSRRLRQFLGKNRAARTAAEVRWLLVQLQRAGSLVHAQRSAARLGGAALREVQAALQSLPDTEDKEFLHQLVVYVTRRDW